MINKVLKSENNLCVKPCANPTTIAFLYTPPYKQNWKCQIMQIFCKIVPSAMASFPCSKVLFSLFYTLNYTREICSQFGELFFFF